MPAKYRFVLNLYDEEKTSSLPPSRRGTASAPPSLRKDLEARKAAAKYYYPTDIFQSLPRHHDLPDFAGSIVPNTENRGDAKSSSSGRKAGKKKKKTVLTESAAGLGEDPASSNTPPEQVLDLRFGPISIDWVDFLPAPSSETTEMVASSHMTSIDYADALRGRTTINAPNGGGGGDATPPRTASSPFSAPETPTPVARFSQLSVSSTAGDGAPADGAPTFLAGSADIAYGIVHLFGDKEEAERSGTTSSAGKGVEAFPALGSASASTSGPGAADSIDAASASTSQDVASTDAQALPKEDDTSGTVLGVLAVPAYMTAADFLAFVEPAADAISHLRMIRDSQPNRCMILMKFRDERDAEEFYHMFNAKPFNAMDADEICHVVHVTSVTVQSSSTLPYAYPLLANSDPWPIVAPSKPTHAGSDAPSSSAAAKLAASLMYELPTCPVCLERMDSSVTGLMTILCQHTFHCSCLSKWGDSRCPVCRYTQTRKNVRLIASSSAEGGSAAPASSCCTICRTTTDLWVCLICASVGCGRYKAGHAHRHYEETGHLYSLELETQRVWDYAGDGYVHRLIQNKADGKLVELPSASSTAGAATERSEGPTDLRSGMSESAQSEKIEAIGLEYSYLLTSQLESQRYYYEDKVRGLQAKFEDISTRFDEARSRADEAERRSSAWERRVGELEKEVVPALEKERAKAEKRAEKAVELARRFERDLETERSVSRGLMANMDKMREGGQKSEKELANVKSEVADLREQLRDVMFFLEARDKVQKDEELAGGDVEVGNSAAAQQTQTQTSSASAKKKKKKKK